MITLEQRRYLIVACAVKCEDASTKASDIPQLLSNEYFRTAAANASASAFMHSRFLSVEGSDRG